MNINPKMCSIDSERWPKEPKKKETFFNTLQDLINNTLESSLRLESKLVKIENELFEESFTNQSNVSEKEEKYAKVNTLFRKINQVNENLANIEIIVDRLV